MTNPNEWNAQEYEEAFYANMPDEMRKALTDENREQLKPLIEQACEKGIPTMKLIEIVKKGMS